jgi:hypothetical protein
MARDEGDESRHDDADVGDIVDAVNANTAVELAQLRLEVQELRGVIGTVLGLDAMTQVLENGFGSLTDELRRLVPPSTAALLPTGTFEHLADLRDSLARPDFSNTGTLPIKVADVPFIGEVNNNESEVRAR